MEPSTRNLLQGLENLRSCILEKLHTHHKTKQFPLAKPSHYHHQNQTHLILKIKNKNPKPISQVFLSSIFLASKRRANILTLQKNSQKQPAKQTHTK
jgi:hypothetical protein